jgi:hypothetical protein
MEKNNILIAALQETKLTSNSKEKKTPNYTLVRKDRGTDKGGGVAFLVHKKLNFSLESTPAILDNDPHLESITISLPGINNNNNNNEIVHSTSETFTFPLRAAVDKVIIHH